MRNQDCLLRVKYSIIVDAESGKSKLFKDKIEKKVTSDDTTAILDEIKMFENKLEHQNRISQTLSKNKLFQSMKRFLSAWKYAYYELLNI